MPKLANEIIPADRRIDQLVPELATICRKHQIECWRQYGIKLVITETRRSRERHLLLWAQGRKRSKLPDEVFEAVNKHAPDWLALPTMPGDQVTWTMDSNHFTGRAYDCVGVVKGKAIWGKDDPIWEKIGVIGAALGLHWLADIGDKPHFELPAKDSLP